MTLRNATSPPSRVLLALVLAALCGFGTACGPSQVEGAAGTDAVVETDSTGDHSADLITAENVLEHERYWPGIVALTKEWTPSGADRPLKVGYRGALVRVNEDGTPRIDFGRHGKHDVPVDVTDLVASSNAVREGRAYKGPPNFLRQIGTRLVDPTTEPLGPVRSNTIANAEAYLCVFADPNQDDFPEFARRLAEATRDTQIQTILFPQNVGREELEAVRDRLAAIDWPVPYMYPHLTGDYTGSLLGVGAELPSILLVSPEGRILHQTRLETAMDLSPVGRVVGS